MSRDYRLRVSSLYFLYLYAQKYKSVASVGLRWPWARVPCTLCTPYCYATVSECLTRFGKWSGPGNRIQQFIFTFTNTANVPCVYVSNSAKLRMINMHYNCSLCLKVISWLGRCATAAVVACAFGEPTLSKIKWALWRHKQQAQATDWRHKRLKMLELWSDCAFNWLKAQSLPCHA